MTSIFGHALRDDFDRLLADACRIETETRVAAYRDRRAGVYACSTRPTSSTSRSVPTRRRTAT